MLVLEILALSVLQTRLLPALVRRRSQHVRVMRGTTATLHQTHAVRARLAGTSLVVKMVTITLCALRVLLTRLLLAMVRRRSQHVRVMRGTTAALLVDQGLVLLVLQARIRLLLAT